MEECGDILQKKEKKILGISIWQPPYESGISMWNMLRLGVASAPFKFGLKACWRMYSCMDAAERLHQEAMNGKPHWALYTIGVTPSSQCKGFGSALISPVLEIIDKSEMSCYLETASLRSVQFFQKSGWDVLKEVDKPYAGPPFWTMLRQPKKFTSL